MSVITSGVSLNLNLKTDTVLLFSRTASTLTLHHSPEMLNDLFSDFFSLTVVPWRGRTGRCVKKGLQALEQ